MKIITISDTHNQHNSIPSKYIDNKDNAIDMLIHSGDVTGSGWKKEVEKFLEWFNETNFKYKIFIAGNHDFFFEKAPQSEITALLAKYPNIIYLNDSGVEIEGLKIWGSPVQPTFYNWAFNRDEHVIGLHWDLIPLDTDILITHGPIRGYVDKNAWGDLTGCVVLLKKLPELTHLKLHVCGHIHEAYGKIHNEGGPIFVNASVLNLRYEMTNRPIEVNIKNEQEQNPNTI